MHQTVVGRNMLCNTTFMEEELRDMKFFEASMSLYAYLTPLVIIIGVIGNSLSLAVFTSKMMRKLSASYYLASLAASDNIVLVTHVLIEWLKVGLPYWPGGRSTNVVGYVGLCETQLLVSYVFRFLSAWLIVIFTVERYIGVCRPLRRRERCTVSFARKTIVGITFAAILLSLYKPILSHVNPDNGACGGKKQHIRLNSILDPTYAMLTTALPLLIIIVLNLLITRQLLITRRRHKRSNFLTEENFLKLEFTFVLLVLSSTFIALSLPYFITWCTHRTQTTDDEMEVKTNDHIRGVFYITKAILYFNYCSNFFLYSVTGGHFRKQLRNICTQRASARAQWNASRTGISTSTYVPHTTGMSPRTSLV